MHRPSFVAIRVAAAAAISLSAITAVFGSSGVGAAAPGVTVPAPADGSSTDQVIVTFDKPGRRLGQADLDAAARGASSARTFGTRSEIVKLPSAQSGATLNATMQRLAKRNGVVRVEADQRMHLVTNDTQYGEQWDLTSPSSGAVGIDVEGAWAITTGSSSIRVAVIDTGYLDHVDIQGRIVGGYDFISDYRIANDGNGRDADAHDTGDWITTQEARSGFFRGCQVRNSSWHGSHVSGTIGAATNNNTGIAGINQVSLIVPIRVLGKCGGYTTDIVDGMRWAAGLSVSGVPTNQHPANVLSLSLGGGGACSSTYQNAINEITNAGAVVVVAAGNSDANAANYSPASCNGVVTVAATGKAGSRSYYSNYGNTIELAAPGGDRLADNGDTILSTINSGTRGPSGSDIYAKYQGTSMATPHVSGVVSLMLSANANLSPAQVTQMLQSSATPFPGGSSCTNVCGAGIVNAAAAVSAANGDGGTTSTSSTTSTTTSTTTSSTTTTSTTTSSTTSTSTTTPAGVPGAFDKLSPSNGQTGLKGRIIFDWGSASNAAGYEVCLDSAPNGRCDGTWTSVSGTSASASGLAKRTTFEWQVRAVNGTGSTDADDGTWFVFTTR